MPRENIHSLTATSEDPRGLTITWWPQREDMDGHVQCATGRFEPLPEGVVARRTGDNGDEPGVTAEMPIFIDLDRQGINRAIRMLKRARDSAFGKDE